MPPALLTTDLPFPKRSGKVRDVYDLGGDRLLIVATDRLSAFDVVLPTGVPGKGKLLTAVSNFWFETLSAARPHHLISTDDVPRELEGRAVIARKASVVLIECVVRGRLAGSAWKEYAAHGTVCGERLPRGLARGDLLPAPIFTPATKADVGHDENVSFARAAELVGAATMDALRARSLALFAEASVRAGAVGLVLADTKFEFGHAADGTLLLVDEILTPDSSRYWDAAEARAGVEPESFDKQFVRDWLEASGWDKRAPGPGLPADVVEGTRGRYVACYERITGRAWAG